MANGHGGARAGAGRKPKREKYTAQITATEDRIADRLPQLIGNLLKLANGGFEQIEEKWLPSALVTIGSGEFESPAFPDKKPDERVLVERKRSVAAPDRAANIYLIDRILGKPTQRTELTGEDGEPLFEPLTDDERAARAAALLDAARARRAGLAADAEPGELS